MQVFLTQLLQAHHALIAASHFERNARASALTASRRGMGSNCAFKPTTVLR